METKKSILLRIDPKLWNDLNEWSKDELRSLNAQIEWALRESIKRRKREKPDSDQTEAKSGNK